jgi:hypothetical protein
MRLRQKSFDLYLRYILQDESNTLLSDELAEVSI